MMYLLIFAFLLCSGMPAAVTAETWVVPDQFLTIQGAIDASSNADSIVVRPGTYIENLLIAGKSITLASLHGPDVTVIDGSAPTRPDTLSVVTAIEVEDLVIDGFTIRHGLGGIDFGELTGGDSGGGFALGAVRGVIRHCVIEDNYCGGQGGGLHLVASDPRIEDCVIRDNECFGNGGGVNIFLGSPVIERCAIENNTAGYAGGGVFMRFSMPQITDARVAGNHARYGGGLYSEQSSSPAVTRSVFSGNSTDSGEGAGGGIACRDGSPRVEHCTVVGNLSPLGGSGVWFSNVLSAVLAHSIVAFNDGGPGLVCGGSLTVECSDIFGNGGGDELCGTDLGGNFALDPLFCSDYSLAESSPCASANAPAGCGLIGALDVGCTGAVEASSWGRIKARYSN